jgi:DNA-binding transcriptional regulator YiaG
MANFAQQLKSEISRISRKELRAETQALKKASAQHRREMAALKRRIASLETAIRRLAKVQPQRVRKEAATEEESTSLRFRAGGFASLRKKLGVSAADMAKLLGVSSQSVYHWEQGKTRPRGAQLALIAEVRKIGKKAVAARLAGE